MALHKVLTTFFSCYAKLFQTKNKREKESKTNAIRGEKQITRISINIPSFKTTLVDGM